MYYICGADVLGSMVTFWVGHSLNYHLGLPNGVALLISLSYYVVGMYGGT